MWRKIVFGFSLVFISFDVLCNNFTIAEILEILKSSWLSLLPPWRLQFLDILSSSWLKNFYWLMCLDHLLVFPVTASPNLSQDFIPTPITDLLGLQLTEVSNNILQYMIYNNIIYNNALQTLSLVNVRTEKKKQRPRCHKMRQLKMKQICKIKNYKSAQLHLTTKHHNSLQLV